MFLSPHPLTLTMVISGAYPSHAALKHINHGNHKELGWSGWKSNAFDSSAQSGCIISPFAGIGAKRDALSVTKELWRSIPPTAHAKCQMQLGKKQKGTLCCGLGLCLEFAFFVFVAFASVFPFPVHGRLELCVHVAPRIRCGAATSQNEKMDF